MPKIRVSNKDRVEDDVMEEILQDPAKFEELLKEREKPPVKPVKKFASPLPSRQCVRLRTSERMDIADRSGDSGLKVTTHSKISVQEPAEGVMELCPRRRPHQGPLPSAHRPGMGQVEKRGPIQNLRGGTGHV